MVIFPHFPRLKQLRTPLTISAVFGCTVAMTSCKDDPSKKDEADKKAPINQPAVDPSAKPSAKGSEKSGDSKPAAPELSKLTKGLNPDIVALVKKVVDGCTVAEDSATAYGCKGGESADVSTFVREKKPIDFYETLSDYALSQLAKSDKKQANAALAMMADNWSTFDEEGKKANATKPASERLLKLLSTFDDAKDSRAARLALATTHIAIIAGDSKKLFAIIDTHKNEWAHTNAYDAYMTFGRLEAFSEVEKAAKMGKDLWTRAALRAPRNMYKATDEERAKVCPWAKTFVGDAKVPIAAEAGNTMVWCGDTYIDVVLDEGEKRLKDKGYVDDFNFVFRDICFSFMGEKGRGSEAQCDRNYKFLESVTNAESVPDGARGMALWSIYYQRRDKKSLDLMRKYEANKNPEIQKRAKEAIKSLTEVYKLK